MSSKTIDYLILGPLPPYRGGIAETQWEFAKALHEKGYVVECWNFSHLYPNFLFPGKTQFTSSAFSSPFVSHRKAHAYNPFLWWRLAKEIRKKKPKRIVFRYWTPFLAPFYGTLARLLPKSLPKIALIDNWEPHEKKWIDGLFNAYMKKKMTHFSTLSENVANEILMDNNQKKWWGFHPLPSHAPKGTSQSVARKTLKIDPQKPLLLFFGLIRPYKGLDLLIKAFSKMPQPASLSIVGEFYTDKAPYLKLIEENNLKEHIHLVDRFVSTEEIALYFSAADMVILPYKNATQSGVLAQAYQYETPLLVTQQPGLAKVVQEDKTGEVSAATAEAIAETAQFMLAEAAQNRYRAQFKKVKNNYKWSSFVEQWTAFVESK